jgi:hypothetical protein
VQVIAAPPDDELIEAISRRKARRLVLGLRRRPYRYATSAPLEEVIVTTADGEEAFILKNLSRDRLPERARAAKPAFLYEPLRELDTYRRLLDPAGIGPTCFAAVADPARLRYWLLIEKVPGVELWQVGELEIWEEVGRWLGTFHGRFAGRTNEVRAANPRLLERSERWFRTWANRAKQALATSPDGRAAELVDMLQRYDREAGIAAALPRTFVHGEFYPANILVVRRDHADVYPVDWEMAGIGPGAIDLAALAGGWDAASRRRIEGAYLDGLRSAGVPITRRELDESLPRCELSLALQWVGWSTDWRPPPQHARDWLGEALRLANEIGL